MWLFKKNVEFLKYVLDVTLKDVDVQAGYPTWSGIHELGLEEKPGVQKGVTWCNRYVERVMRKLGYNVDVMLNPNPVTKKPDIGWTSANSMVKNLLENRKVFQIPEWFAQKLANLGVGVVIGARGSGKSGHVGVVYPHEWNPIMGVFVAQAGGFVGKYFKNNKNCFNVEGIEEPYYFVLRRNEDGKTIRRIGKEAYFC